MEVSKPVKYTSLNENREGKRSFLSSEPGTSYLNFSPVTKVQTGIDKVLEQVIIATDINPDKTEINFSFPQENALFIHPRSVEFFFEAQLFYDGAPCTTASPNIKEVTFVNNLAPSLFEV